MAVITQEELVEAVKEWCDRRGIPVSEDIEFHASHQKGSLAGSPVSPNYSFYVQIRGITMPVKEGPYR